MFKIFLNKSLLNPTKSKASVKFHLRILTKIELKRGTDCEKIIKRISPTKS